MHARRLILHMLVTVWILSGSIEIAFGTEYYVATNGLGINDGLSWGSPWASIRLAVQEATNNGDVVNIGEGDFLEDWFFINRAITIQGADTYDSGGLPLFRHTTLSRILPRPGSPGTERPLISVWTNNVTIRNLTFDGNFNTNIAGGILNEYGNTTIEQCTFKNIKNDIVGAYAILSSGIDESNPTPDSEYNHFTRNLFQDIIEYRAAGIYLKHSPSLVANNEFNTITGGHSQAGIVIEKCYMTNGSPLRTSVDSNYLYNCTQGIWGNDFAYLEEEILVRDNVITNTLVGIRITSADGPAIITGNFIAVGGVAPTTNATPARGIWIQADSDPWGIAPTDHQIINNTILDISTNEGTTGVLLEYDTTTWSNHNSGVRATVTSNSLSDFDIGLYVEAGTNQILHYHSPLVEVTAQYNDIDGSETWSILAEGMTNSVTATDNWLGTYANPSNAVSGNVNFSNTVISGSLYEDYDGDGTNDFADADDDNDMLLDTNEVAIGTSAVATDTDYDGQTDWEEYKVTGTDPTDRESIFEMTITTNAPESFSLAWPSAVSRKYTLYRSTNLSLGFGSAHTNLFAGPPSNTFVDTTATNASQYFYKLSVTNLSM